jgi:hypothetical protein
MTQPRDPRYAAAGVDSTKAEAGLARLRAWVEKTFALRPPAPAAGLLRQYHSLRHQSGISFIPCRLRRRSSVSCRRWGAEG